MSKIVGWIWKLQIFLWLWNSWVWSLSALYMLQILMISCTFKQLLHWLQRLIRDRITKSNFYPNISSLQYHFQGLLTKKMTSFEKRWVINIFNDSFLNGNRTTFEVLVKLQFWVYRQNFMASGQCYRLLFSFKIHQVKIILHQNFSRSCFEWGHRLSQKATKCCFK